MRKFQAKTGHDSGLNRSIIWKYGKNRYLVTKSRVDQRFPRSIDDEKAFYIGLRGGLNYTRTINKDNKLELRYGVNANFYESLDQFNSQNHKIKGIYKRTLAKNLGAQFELGFSDYVLGGNEFRHLYNGSAKLLYRHDRKNRTIVSLNYMDEDYKFALRHPNLDRNAHSFEISLRHEKALSSGRAVLSGTAGQRKADGDEYDKNYWRLSGSYTFWLKKQENGFFKGRPQIQLSSSYRDEDYDNRSLFSLKGKNQRKDLVQLGVYIGLPVNKLLKLFVSYRFMNHGSNIPVFDYGQNKLSFGIDRRL